VGCVVNGGAKVVGWGGVWVLRGSAYRGAGVADSESQGVWG